MVLKEKAIARINENKSKYSGIIQTSIRESKIYDEKEVYSSVHEKTHGNISLVNMDTITAAISACDNPESNKVAVLNFASFTAPGGGFINGAMAQEEAICHSSTLYNVLDERKDYYEQNKENVNNGLYADRALYTPSIVFFGKEKNKVVDVVTCAAPSKTTALFYGISEELINQTLDKRIAFIYDVALSNQVDTFVLGAWGCGVFGNDPAKVCKYMMSHCPKEMSVIFAIPGGVNYETFKKVMESEE